MKRAYAMFIVVSLLIMGFSILPGDNSIAKEIETLDNSFNCWRLGMDINDASLASFKGETGGDGSGYSVSGVGDVNGDGYDDILISAPYRNGNIGEVYLIFGNASGWSLDMNLANANASYIGEGGSNSNLMIVSGAGDVNGDGYDDFLIGVPLNKEGGKDSLGWGAGQAYLILGKATGWSMDTDLGNVDASFIGEEGGDNAGRSVSCAGDVNGDGYDDILIGAWWSSEGGGWHSGQAYLIFGKPTGWSMDTNLSNSDASFLGFERTEYFGDEVSSAGDVNGDGYDDILIGAFHEGSGKRGQTYLYLGRSSGWSMDMKKSSANASFYGGEIQDYSGYSVSGAGDVNGDGYDDFLISAHWNDTGGLNAGQAYLFLGKAAGWSGSTDLSDADASFVGKGERKHFGGFLSGAGDVNGDGYDDIVIGAGGNDVILSNADQAYLILGKSSGWAMGTNLTELDASFNCEYSSDFDRCYVSGAGDVNGDGYNDILIGASYAGKTYMIPGGEGYLKFRNDQTPSTATTGDEITFSVMMEGIIPVSSMFVEYWFGGGEHARTPMTGINDTTWNHTIIIPSDSLTNLSYNFSASIISRFWINTSVRNITITDNDCPEFKEEFSDVSGYTGDPFTMSIDVTDNIGVEGMDIEYWFGSGDHKSMETERKSSTRWESIITIPSNSIEPLNYRYNASDGSGNFNVSQFREIPINDDDRPVFVNDSNPGKATTGDQLELTVNVTDNIGISSVYAEYWYDDETSKNQSMEKGENDEWFCTITIPDMIGTLHYIFHAVDQSDNSNQNMINHKVIKDNDPPEFGTDTSDTSATTGDVFNFRVEVSENIDLDKKYVEYWSNPDETKQAALSIGDPYTTTITVPMNWTQMSYRFCALDSSDNYRETEVKTIDVLDNDPPLLIENMANQSCGTGSEFQISLKASDNIEMSGVVCKYRFGSDAENEFSLDRNGNIFSGSIVIPLDSLDSLYYILKISDTSGNVNTTSTFEVLVFDATPPSLKKIENITIYVGDAINITLEAEDNIGIASYSWLGSPIEDGGDHLRGIVNEEGEYSVSVIVRDDEGNSDNILFRVTVLPLNNDKDEDGIPDLIEMKYGLNPDDISDGQDDIDDDGLSNREEFVLGTEMNQSDSDGDGQSDGYEVANGYDPLDSKSFEKSSDSEEDGASGTWVWLLITAIVVVLLIIGVIVFFVFIKKPEEKQIEQESEKSAMDQTLPNGYPLRPKGIQLSQSSKERLQSPDKTASISSPTQHSALPAPQSRKEEANK